MLPNYLNRLPFYANLDSAEYNLDGLPELKDDSVRMHKYSNPNAWPIPLKKSYNHKRQGNDEPLTKCQRFWIMVNLLDGLRRPHDGKYWLVVDPLHFY